ncbi:hypothetical protein O181_020628 [Austropuccinia psidii MF-1]|uniref:Reverse transcriptase domain-containing protein n=1 Tax=Austropuccinia psidii MF-1 TaxID=1389203 RepID=A0A9Q3CDA2_9BASI|nr:hypothetical protein [Austropuccinia psidii MF-1]
MTIIARNISNQLEMSNFFDCSQAGFRSRQEATAQVIALSEIIQRQRNAALATHGLYIDFKKVFDRVPHEGLWAKLRKVEIHPKLINLLRHSYDNASIECFTDNTCSKPFPRPIGTRQGCPFSPLLFNIFVNDVLSATTKGIPVPSCNGLQWGLLFSDDTLALAESFTEVQDICTRLTTFCRKWHSKSLVVPHGPPELLLQEGLYDHVFHLDGGKWVWEESINTLVA